MRHGHRQLTPSRWSARPVSAESIHVLVAHPGAQLFGSDRMLAESVRAMREAGWRVTVALPGDGPAVAVLQSLGAEVVIVPMFVLRKRLLKPSQWATLLGDAWRGWWRSRRVIRLTAPDVVYVSTITVPQWPLAASVSRIPAVTHVHEAEGSAGRLINQLLYLPQLFSRRLIVNSGFSAGILRSASPILWRRSRILYNGVRGPESLPIPPRLTLESVRLLYIGRLSPRKGVDVAVEALRVLRAEGVNARLDVVGAVFEGYEWYEDELRHSADSTELQGRVRFLGFQPDVWPFLAASDILVVPSIGDEPFGNTAVEGALAARLVIASDTSGLREATSATASAILVHPADPSALADAVTRAVENWGSLREVVVDDVARTAAKFDPLTYRQALRSAILTVAAGAGVVSSRRCNGVGPYAEAGGADSARGAAVRSSASEGT